MDVKIGDRVTIMFWIDRDFGFGCVRAIHEDGEFLVDVNYGDETFLIRRNLADEGVSWVRGDDEETVQAFKVACALG